MSSQEVLLWLLVRRSIDKREKLEDEDYIVITK